MRRSESHLFDLYVTLGWQVISSRRLREARRHFMAEDIWHRFFCDRIKPWCHDETDIHESVTAKRRSDVYHLLPMCHAHIEVRINFSASECQLSYPFFSKLPWISQQTQRVSTLWLCCIPQLIRRTLRKHNDMFRLTNNSLSGHKNIGFFSEHNSHRTR